MTACANALECAIMESLGKIDINEQRMGDTL